MKLVSPRFQNVILWEEDKICSLIIESPDVFRELLSDFVSELNGMESGMILSHNGEPVKMANHLELILSYIPFEVNTKRLVSNLLSVLESEAVNEEHYVRTQELLADIERYMDELSFRLPAKLEYKISISSLLKMTSPRLNLEGTTGIEEIYQYMQFYREVIGERLFVFINLRSYYNECDVAQFIETVVAHKFRILLIDNREFTKLPYENRLIIDIDRCEF